MTATGATNTAVFLAFATAVLIPVLKQRRPDTAVVRDNLTAHEATIVCRALEAVGISYRYLSAYSPDPRQMALGHFRENPIELAWSKLKAKLRATAARTRMALEQATPEALATITPSNAQGWFRHAGYPLTDPKPILGGSLWARRGWDPPGRPSKPLKVLKMLAYPW